MCLFRSCNAGGEFKQKTVNARIQWYEDAKKVDK